MGNRRVTLGLTAAMLAALTPAIAQACAVCGLDGPGAVPTAALLFLMAMPFVIAGSIGAWLLYLHLRARETGEAIATARRSAWRQRMDPLTRPVFRSGLILIVLGVISAGALAWLRPVPGSRHGVLNASQTLQVSSEVPSFSLIDQSRRRITREDLLGKVWIANFIFTSCQLTCPRQSATMAQLQTDLASEPDIRLVSITIDPDHDTPEVLARYAERFHADLQRWLFLTGEERAIYALAQDGFHLAAGVVPAVVPTPVEHATSRAPDAPASRQGTGLSSAATVADSKDTLVHDARFALVDRKARIRGYYSGLDPEAIARLRRDVKDLLEQEG